MKPARSVDAAESHPSRPAEAVEQSEPHIYPVESATLASRYYNPTDFRTIMTNLQTRQDPSMKAENWGAQHNARTGAPVIARPLAGGQPPRPGASGRSEDPADPRPRNSAVSFWFFLITLGCCRTVSQENLSKKVIPMISGLDVMSFFG